MNPNDMTDWANVGAVALSPRGREVAAKLAGDLQADVLRRTLAQLDPYAGLRAALARQDRTRGWLS